MIARVTLLYAMRIAVLSLGAFTIGFALYIGWIYHRGGLHSGLYGRGRHVAFIVASYCLLAAGFLVEIAQHTIHGEPVTWRLPVAVVAFGLGSYALYQLLSTRAREARSP